MRLLQAAWAYRYFIVSSIRNDFKSRFARSKLGGLWMVLHPLAQVLIFALVLSEILSARLPGVDNKYAYALYLLAGTLCWSLFSESVTRLVDLFVNNASLLKKVAFPRICLPFITLGTVLVTNGLLALSVFAVFGVLGHAPGVQVLWLPLLVTVTMLLAFGIGLLLATFNAFTRDVGQVVPIVMQLLFWLTPVVYTIDIIPEKYRHLFALNPVYALVASYQNVLVFNKPPLLSQLAVVALIAGLLVLLSLLLFRRASADMVDVL